jgi:PKD repeat protein/DNA-directed RNA polymerase subunit M/transcription elongation factor TFIIS
MDGYSETARIYYDVDTTTVYAEIRVICSIYDLNTSKLIKEISDSYTIFRNIDIQDTYFEFRAGYTGAYDFVLAVYDLQHSKKEYGGNDYPAGNITLEVNPYLYRIIADATSYDGDADGYNDDVKILVYDSLNYTIPGAEVYINGELEGTTNQDGILFDFNLPRGIHEVDVFYSGLHGNTDFKSEGTGQELKIYADADPFDDDFDGFVDDVLIRVYATNYYPLPNADVFIDQEYYGTTDQQGLVYAYNFDVGFHDVWVTTRNFQAFTIFYAEEDNVTDYEEYFFRVIGNVVALNPDGWANDIDIYIDVDISDGKTSNVTVNATVFYENRTIAALGSISYQTTGSERENKHIYIRNLTNNLTYFIRCDLIDDGGNLEDVWYLERLVIQVAFGNINVDNWVFDLNNDDQFNDVIFYAHIKNSDYLRANIRVYFKSNSTMAANLTTNNSGGIAVAENMYYTNYTWVAYDNSFNPVDNGTFELYRRNPFRTVQVWVQQLDIDNDAFHDDFMVRAYNSLGLPETNVSVQVKDDTDQVVAQGFTTRLDEQNMGGFMVEDLQVGFYKYSASVLFGITEYHLLSTGWFYSYGNSTESTRNLNAFAEAFDFDSDGYKNDVKVTVTDRNAQPVMNALVFFDDDVQNGNNTDMNGEVIARNFVRGWHNVDVVYLSSTPPTLRGAQAFTRFFSEGLNYDEYFWFISANVHDADNDNQWNDLNVSMDVDVDEFVEVKVTVIIEIFFESNDTLAAKKSVTLEIYNAEWDAHFTILHNLPYNETYYANYTLKDNFGNIEDQRSQSNIFIIPIKPIVNIDVALYNISYYEENSEGNIKPRSVFFWAEILDNGIENILIEIYYKSNNTKIDEDITDEWGHAHFNDLVDGDYYFKAKNISNYLMEYGEFNIGNHIAWIQEDQDDVDHDAYHDDFEYTANKVNYTYEENPLGDPIITWWTENINLSVTIYDSQNNIIDQGDTSSFVFYTLNYTEGYYFFNATYQTQRVTNGTFYSYGNGFDNQPPVAIISEPLDASVWNNTDTITFDGSSSNDPDTTDILTFYWESNITGPLGFTDQFSRKLPVGIHKITLFVDDGHGHNSTDSVTITVNQYIAPSTNQLPTADAGSDQNNVPVNSTVTLDGSGSSDPDGFITEYNWTLVSKPAGSAAVLNSTTYVKPKFFADKLGEYRCKLGVKDNDSAWSVVEDEVIVTVIQNRIPIVNISSPPNLAMYNTTPADTIFFESNGTYDPDDDTDGNGTIDGTEQDNLIYSWTAYQGNATPVVISTLANFNSTSVPTSTYEFIPGAHMINLTVRDSLGGNASAQVEINISNVPPVANISSPTDGEMFNKFAEIELDGSATADPDNTTFDLYYYWLIEKSGESPIIITNLSKPRVQLDEGDYTITLWVDDGVTEDLFGRAHNVSTMVNITVENRAPVARAGFDQKINLGEVAYFNGSASFDFDGFRDEENFTYTWDFGDSSGTGVGMAVNYSYMDGGMYNVTLTIDDGSLSNSTATDNLTIIINQIPNARAGQDITDAMVDEPVLLDASDSYDDDTDDVLRYRWTFDAAHANQDTAWDTSPFANVTYGSVGVYTATLNVTDGFAYDTATIQITVLKSNSAPVCAAGSDISNVDVDEVIQFSGGNCSDPDAGDILTFSWDFGDGTTSTGENVTHRYSDNGVYKVTLNITDGEMWANDTLTVTVRPKAAEIESPNDGSSVEKTVIITGSTEGSGITAVEIKIGNSAWTEVVDDSSDWSTWSYEWDTTDEDNEEFTIQVRVKTSYATSEITSISVTVSNAEPLSIAITSHNEGANIRSKTATISGTCTGEGISRVEVKVGSNNFWEPATDTSGDWSTWNYVWDTTDLENNKRYVITVRVVAGTETLEDSVNLNLRLPGDTTPDEPTEDSGDLLGFISDMSMMMLAGCAAVILIVLLIIIFMIVRSRRRRRFREQEEEFMRLEREEEKELVPIEEKEGEEVVEKAVEEGKEVVRQPVRCPKCKEYSVIEDDGQRPLMIECVHCGAKGYISDKPKLLSAPKLPEKEEDKLIIQCPKCEEMFTVDDEVGDITCPNCGVEGHLDEETLEELRAAHELTEEEPDTGLTTDMDQDLGMDIGAPPDKLDEFEPGEPESEKKVKCPNCSTRFNIPAGADRIECPSCGASGGL